MEARTNIVRFSNLFPIEIALKMVKILKILSPDERRHICQCFDRKMV